MRTYARTHSTHARKARTHARKHAPRRARMHTCSLRRSTLHFLDFRQMSCLKRDPRTQLAQLAGTRVRTQAHRHAGTHTQARRHASTQPHTYKQHADARTHARAHARTLARMHHVHVSARVTAQSEQIPTGTYRQEPFATVTGAKQTPTGTASSGAPPQTLCGGTPGAFRRTAGLATTDDGSRSIAGHDEAWGLFSTSWLTRTTTQRRGLPGPTPKWLQSAHHASLSTFETHAFRSCTLQIHAGIELQTPGDPSPQGLCISKRPKKR